MARPMVSYLAPVLLVTSGVVSLGGWLARALGGMLAVVAQIIRSRRACA